MTKSYSIRYRLLDNIRGICLISMILYHVIWDLVYIFGLDIPWHKSEIAFIWQQSICWTFIMLSGFCWSFSRHNLKRGLLVLGCSVVISLVTLIFMPDSKILFGVLSLIGSAMLLMLPLDKLYKRVNPFIGLIICFALFMFTRNINGGSLGFLSRKLIKLPEALYSNTLTAYLGFPFKGFSSTDYFPILPWIFLYQTGYFLHQIFVKRNWLEKIPNISFNSLEWLGKNSLIVYMIHQPVVYGVLWLVFAVTG